MCITVKARLYQIPSGICDVQNGRERQPTHRHRLSLMAAGASKKSELFLSLTADGSGRKEGLNVLEVTGSLDSSG